MVEDDEFQEKITTEIFLPLKYKTYKESKVNLLKTSLLAVKTLDRIKRIQELNKIKTEQRRLLRGVIKEIKITHNKIIKLLPTDKEVKISGKIKKTISTNISTMPKRRVFNVTSRIDDELTKIQEKLNNLRL